MVAVRKVWRFVMRWYFLCRVTFLNGALNVIGVLILRSMLKYMTIILFFSSSFVRSLVDIISVLFYYDVGTKFRFHQRNIFQEKFILLLQYFPCFRCQFLLTHILVIVDYSWVTIHLECYFDVHWNLTLWTGLKQFFVKTFILC